MKLLNVFPFKPGDLVVQVPVRPGHNRHYWVTSCQYGGGTGWDSRDGVQTVSIALRPTDKAFGTYPCDWFRKVTDEVAE